MTSKLLPVELDNSVGSFLPTETANLCSFIVGFSVLSVGLFKLCYWIILCKVDKLPVGIGLVTCFVFSFVGINAFGAQLMLAGEFVAFKNCF